MTVPQREVAYWLLPWMILVAITAWEWTSPGTDDVLSEVRALSEDAVIVLADVHGTIRAVSNNIAMVTGWQPEQLLGQPLEMIIAPELRGQHNAAFASRAARRGGSGAEVRIQNGRMALADARLVPCRTVVLEMVQDGGKMFIARIQLPEG